MERLVHARCVGFGDPSPPAPSPLQERGSQMQKSAEIASKWASTPLENEWNLWGGYWLRSFSTYGAQMRS